MHGDWGDGNGGAAARLLLPSAVTVDSRRAKVEYYVLGSMEVRDRDTIVDIGPRMPRALLAVLLLEPGCPVSVNRLIDVLWGETPPAGAHGALQVYISNLRRVLEPGRTARADPTVLVRQTPGYCLRVPPGSIDAERFTALVAAGQGSLAAGDPMGAAAAQREALALWRGTPYADIGPLPCLQPEIARLSELRSGAWETLAEAELALGGHAALIADLEQLTTEEPIRERRWELRALALYRSGRQTEALRVLRQARTALIDELGIEPGPRLRRLEHDILQQAPSLDWQPPGDYGDRATTRAGHGGRSTGAGPSSPAGPAGFHAAPPSPAPGQLLVGRDAELALLDLAVDDAVVGRGRVALISGEPGIGKTRLAEELSRRAGEHGVQVAWGRAPEGEAAPAYWPWVQIVRSLAAGADPTAIQRALAADAEELARLVPEVETLAGRPLAGVSVALSETARTRLYDAVVGFVLRLAADRPLLLVIDDLHWADWPTLQVVQLLAQRLATARVMLVATYREQDTGTSGPVVATLAALTRTADLLRVRPSGLNEDDIALLVAHTTGHDADRRVTAAIRARTEGNPFFVSELLQLLQASGRLAGSDEDAAAREIPLGVRDVVRQRLAALPEACRSLLGPAAVAGRVFDLEVVAGVAGLDENRALELVESALALGVLFEEPGAVGSYRFSHVIVLETVYDGLSALRRARLHHAIGLAMAGAGLDDDRAAEIADHFLAATPGGDSDEAYGWALRAADHAGRILAFEQSEELLERAVALARRHRSSPEALRRELAACRRIAAVLLMKHWYGAPEVGQAWSRAAEVCRRVDDSPDVLPCLWGAWSYRYVRGDLTRALELAREMVSRAERTGDVVFDVVGNHCAGIISVHLGRFRDAGEHLRRVEARVDRVPADFYAGTVFEPDLRSAHHLFRGLIECLAVGPEGVRTLDDSLAGARRLGRPLSVAAALFLAALGRIMFDDRPGAERLAGEGMAISDEHGFRLFAAMMGILRGAAASDPTAIRDALGDFNGTGSRMLLPVFWGLLAEAERARGHHDDALVCVQRGLGEAASTGERFWGPELHRLRGELLLEGFHDQRLEAEAALLEGLALARDQGAHVLEQRIADSLRQTQST